MSRFSFNCADGCGECSVRIKEFEAYRSETLEGELIAREVVPQATCAKCGAGVDIWDESEGDVYAPVVLAAAEAAAPLVTDEMRSAVRWAPSSAHWSQKLIEFFGPDARDGINALEKQLRDALALAAPAQAAKLVAWGEPDAAGNIIDTITKADYQADPTAWHKRFTVPLYTRPPADGEEPLQAARAEQAAQQAAEPVAIYQFRSTISPSDGRQPRIGAWQECTKEDAEDCERRPEHFSGIRFEVRRLYTRPPADDALLGQALEALTNSIDLVAAEASNAAAQYRNVPSRAAKVEGLKRLAEAHQAAIVAIDARLSEGDA